VRLAQSETIKAAVRKEAKTGVQVMAAYEAQLPSQNDLDGTLQFLWIWQLPISKLVAAQADQAQSVYTLFFQEVLMKHALGTLESNRIVFWDSDFEMLWI